MSVTPSVASLRKAAAVTFGNPIKKRRKLPKWLHKLLVLAHVASAMGWLSYVALVLLLCVHVARTSDPHLSVAVFRAFGVFNELNFGVISFVVMGTGLALTATTAWGLTRHWWVLAKLSVTVAVITCGLLIQRPAVQYLHDQAVHAGTEGLPETATVDGRLFTLTIATLVAFVFLGMTAIVSSFKPWGTTPWSHRKAAPAAETNSRLAIPRPRSPEIKIPIVIDDVQIIAEEVRALRLLRADGLQLPSWEPGAHIDVLLPSGRVRQYSLCGDPAELDSYLIGVQLEEAGRGGSAEMHELRKGDAISIHPPRNNFPFIPARSYLFLAAGIGITPMVSMIAKAHSMDAEWKLMYAARSRSRMAFADELLGEHADNVELCPEDVQGRPDLAALAQTVSANTRIYACGPPGFLNALTRTLEEARMITQLHIERFTPAAAAQRNDAFAIQLSRTGCTVMVAAEQSALEAIRTVVPTFESSCENGVCGCCEVRLLGGKPEHRDQVFAGAGDDRDSVFFPCISRASGGETLVLDL